VIWACSEDRKAFSHAANRDGSMLSKLKEAWACRTHADHSIDSDRGGFIGTSATTSPYHTAGADNILKTADRLCLPAPRWVSAPCLRRWARLAHRITVRRMLISGGFFSIFLGHWRSRRLLVVDGDLLLIGFASITCATATNTLLQLNNRSNCAGE